MPAAKGELQTRIRVLIEKSASADRFRERVQRARGEYFDSVSKCDAFRQRRREHAKAHLNDSRYRNGSEDPPGEGWVFEAFGLATHLPRLSQDDELLTSSRCFVTNEGEVRRERVSVGLWFPPGLRSDDAPPDPDPATPTEHPDGYTPTLAMKYAILAALNDAAARPAILIDPWRNAEKKTAGGAWYDSLRTWAKALNLEGDGEWTGKLVLWFEDVQTEIERMLPAGMSHLDSLELNGAGMAQTVKENAAKPEAAGKGAGGSDDVLKGEAKALALLVAHPEWSNTQIAKAVPCNLRTLHKWKLFKQARAALKSTRATVAHGSKDRKTHRVEAWGGDDD